MWDYTERVKDHFLNPRNVGQIEAPDGIGEVGSLACGDALRLTFKLDEKKRIKDARFKTFGCASAIASSSALTEIIKGMTLEEAEKVTNQDIAEYLGGLPEEKMHCSVMGREALDVAISNYRGQKLEKEDFEVVCNCFGVTDREIVKAIRENHLKTVEQVTYYTKAGGGCGQCHPKIEAIVEKVGKEMEEVSPRPKPEKKKLTNIQRIKLIEETLGREIIPALKADGGDLDLIDIEGNKVYVALRGSCSFCPSAEVTLKQYVETKLKEFVSDDIVVEEVRP
jgi:NifU-like protein